MSRNLGAAHAALISLLVAGCGTTAIPAPTATAPAVTAPPTASAPAATAPTALPPTPTTTRNAQPVTTTEPSPVAVSCFGDDLLWDLLPPPARAYALAWLAAGDEGERLTLLEEAMAADGSYADPETADRVSGLPAIADHISTFHDQRAGHFFRVRAWQPTDEHHDYVRVRWILCRATDGRITLEGEDILVLDEAGMIRQATRFVDP